MVLRAVSGYRVGQKRREVENKRVLQERLNQLSLALVMRVCRQLHGRSVDRDTRRPGIELRHQLVRDVDAVNRGRRQHGTGRHGKSRTGPAQSETLSMCGNSSRGNREIPPMSATGSGADRSRGRFYVKHPKQEPSVANTAHWDLCGGRL